ncbi:MAG: hypothetical protein ABI679_07335, partial [Gemmatimonadota bacterium]
ARSFPKIPSMKIYINDQSFEATAGHDVFTAIGERDPALGRKIASGEAYVTDARGVRLAGNEPLQAGAILRVITTSRKGDFPSDADA